MTTVVLYVMKIIILHKALIDSLGFENVCF
jgi:hypothetical protein